MHWTERTICLSKAPNPQVEKCCPFYSNCPDNFSPQMYTCMVSRVKNYHLHSTNEAQPISPSFKPLIKWVYKPSEFTNPNFVRTLIFFWNWIKIYSTSGKLTINHPEYSQVAFPNYLKKNWNKIKKISWNYLSFDSSNCKEESYQQILISKKEDFENFLP